MPPTAGPDDECGPNNTSNHVNNAGAPSSGRGWRFWAIFLALAITSLLAAVENTVTATALPHIAGALQAGEVYVWFANAYTLAR